MKTTYNYNDPNEQPNIDKAMLHTIAYIGEGKFKPIQDELIRVFIAHGTDKLRSTINYVGLVLGIEGYPLHAWYEFIINLERKQ